MSILSKECGCVGVVGLERCETAQVVGSRETYTIAGMLYSAGAWLRCYEPLGRDNALQHGIPTRKAVLKDPLTATLLHILCPPFTLHGSRLQRQYAARSTIKHWRAGVQHSSQCMLSTSRHCGQKDMGEGYIKPTSQTLQQKQPPSSDEWRSRYQTTRYVLA